MNGRVLGLGWAVWVAAICLWATTGCRAPVGVERQGLLRVQRGLESVYLSGRVSDDARMVLQRRGLAGRFEREPDETLGRLHEAVVRERRRDELHALADLAFVRAHGLSRSVRPGERERASGWYLAAAAYAWFFVLGDGSGVELDPLDRRLRDGCEIYNAAVGLAFRGRLGTNAVVAPRGGDRAAGPGTVRVAWDGEGSRWNAGDVAMWLPAAEYRVRGLAVRDRVSGLGAPLIGVGRPEAEQGRLARRWPATLFLRFHGRLEDWVGMGLGAALEVYSTHEVATVEVAGRRVALEADFTAPLAHGLKGGEVWALGILQLLTGEERVRSNIYLTEPYQRGKIPVVFVHGTASSPAYWAEMWNTLRSDPVVRGRFQFWNFVYNSANPVGESAARLRGEIERKLRQLDPDGKDGALRQLVVVGHSQGGLLAELTAKDTGDALWRAVSTKEFGELELPASELEEVRRRYFFTAVPSVRRVVFISTPHRGSHLATSFVRSVAIRVIRLPADVVRSSARLLALRDPLGLRPEHERRVPSSLDDMSPRNPWLLALADIPPAPGVAAHSIVAIRGREGPPEGGDGVVSYQSAHVEYARSEFVVRSGHSCQRRSDVIEEVRRILMEHMAESAPAGGKR